MANQYIRYPNPVSSSTITGSGTANQVAYFSGANTIASSSNFVFTGTQVGIPDGLVATPGLAFAAALSMGLYRTGASSFGVSCGGTLSATFSDTVVRFFTASVQFNDGTVAAPSLAFTNAPTMGFYRTGAASFGISSGNNWIGQFDGSGNQIKGSVAAPLKVLSVEGNSSFAAIYHDNSGHAVFENTFASGSVYLNTNSITRLAIDSSGNIQLGTGATTPTHILNTATAATASAGGSTLPATPEGFVVITINGTARKIPYYPT